jgi:beta-glucosidase
VPVPTGDDVARDIAGLVAGMTLDEKASLTAGIDLWSTAPIERLGIPPAWLTDGPNGARGVQGLPGWSGDADAPLSVCVPCGAALGATWDVDLLERVGELVGGEAREKACRVLLAPTVNLHRSPLGGRNFESYAEDPLLAGKLAAAFVRGAQSRGVATTVKHFVCNESEHERNTHDVVVDERALRELYLVPFELAVREGGALGIMTSYNRVNGRFVADDDHLVTDVLRGEWGFDGFVVTDWFALADTVAAARAGLDLEMPGPARAFGAVLADAVRAGLVDEALVDAAATRLLRVLDMIGALDDPVERRPTGVDRPEDRALAHRAAAASMVLLRNDGVLPIDIGGIRTLALLGPNAGRAVIMGGGSAQLPAHHRTSPLEAFVARLGEAVEIVHEPGVDIARSAPALDGAWLTAPDGRPGLRMELYAGHDLPAPGSAREPAAIPPVAVEPVAVQHRADASLWTFGPPAPGLSGPWSARATATLRAPAPGTYVLSLVTAGEARVLLDGAVVLTASSIVQPRGHEFFGLASEEVTVELALDPEHPAELVVELTDLGAGAFSGAKLGCRTAPAADLLDRAVAAAAGADAVVLVVGTDLEWEAEGHDRASLHLPGAQDELVARVLAVRPDAVVVVNAGSPVAMPWVDTARALLQVWFGGQEMAPALVDVVVGDAEPGGRLPHTVPVAVEHTPSFGNFPAENGTIRYGEGVLVGYRWYEARGLPVRFPFGHGLSYTTTTIGAPTASSATWRPGEQLAISMSVTNTGHRAGSEVVQCYVEAPAARLTRPRKELRAFAKVWLDPGETRDVVLVLDDRAFAYWDPGDPAGEALAARLRAVAPWNRMPEGRGRSPGWRVDAGEHRVHVGRSSVDLAHVVPVAVIADAAAP